jgi:hypothetical protein
VHSCSAIQEEASDAGFEVRAIRCAEGYHGSHEDYGRTGDYAAGSTVNVNSLYHDPRQA